MKAAPLPHQHKLELNSADTGHQAKPWEGFIFARLTYGGGTQACVFPFNGGNLVSSSELPFLHHAYVASDIHNVDAHTHTSIPVHAHVGMFQATNPTYFL